MRVLALAIVLAACGSSAPAPARVSPAGEVLVASNVLRPDYAGSAACEDCHQEVYDAWAHSPMRNMTRDAATATIRAPFDGATLRIGDDACTMETEGGVRFMRITTPRGTTRYRVTKVIGGRYREDFVGIEIGGPSVERVLPATYVFATRSWRYKGYSVMVKERPRMSTGAVWSTTCIPCHNTLPLATMLYDELYGDGLPSYQGKLSDRLLPQRLLWTTRSRADGELAGALRDEVDFLGGEPPADASLRAALTAAAVATEAHLDGPKLVEIGVGCEACHNGARAHAAEPDVRPTFAAVSPLLEVHPPGGRPATRAQWINRTCAKCHTVLFSRYPYTWEGGVRGSKGSTLGGSTTNSGEGRDFQLGGCASQMACTTCHDPHAPDPAAALAQLATPAGNKTCTACHSAYATEEAVARHSHHAAGSAGSACVACHMPKKNMGLDYGLVRYHRIGSPTDKVRVEHDRPLECALCHAEQSVEALASTMERWYGKRFDREALRGLYGDDLGVNTIRATLRRGKPHEQAVAIATLGDQGDRRLVRALAPYLAHPYPLVRYYAQRALQKLTGAPVAIDLGAPAAEITTATRAWLQGE